MGNRIRWPRARTLCWFVGSVLVILPQGGQAQPTGSGGSLYGYVDERGSENYVGSLDQVPADRRHTLKRVGQGTTHSVLSRPDPKLLRGAPDEDLVTAAEARRRAILDSPSCAQASEVDAIPWWRQLVETHGHLLFIGGLVLVLLLMTPAMMRLIGAPAWSRTLTLAIQALGFLGLMTHALVGTRHAYQQLREVNGSCQQAAQLSFVGEQGEGAGEPTTRFGLDAQALMQRIGALERLEAVVKEFERHQAVVSDSGFEAR
jgi:hypothetical protein